jgi:hypothetical protein
MLQPLVTPKTKESVAKIEKFLLDQELVDAKVVGRSVASGAASHKNHAVPITAADHVTQVALETCRCIHLQEYLPHILDLELCKAVHHPRGWVVANPVHSMHLASQLEESSPNALMHAKQPPILYGEEQQRTIALHTEGIVEYWCPLDGYSAVIHDDTAMEKMEHMPTLGNFHKQQQQQQQQQQQHQEQPKSHPYPNLTSSPSSTTRVAAPMTTAPSSSMTPTSLQQAFQPPQTTPTSGLLPESPQSSKAQPPSLVAGKQLPVSPGTILPPPAATTTTTSNAVVVKMEAAASSTPGSSQKGVQPSDDCPPPPAPAPASPSTTSSMNPPPSFSKSNDVNTTYSLPAAAAAAPKPEGVPSSPETVASSATTPATTTTTTESAMTKSATTTTTTTTMNTPSTTTTPASSSPYELSDHQYHHWRLEEDRIRLIRQALPTHRLNSNIHSNKRSNKNNVDNQNNTTKKKRKRESFEYYKPASIPGWRASAPKELNPDQEEDWKAAMVAAREKVEGWMDHYRLCRQSYWDEQKDDKPQGADVVSSFYMPQERTEQQKRCCKLCVSKPHGDPYWDGKQHKKESKKRRSFSGDDLMQCLECSFIGCSPKSLAPDSRQHILQHLLLTGHTFGKQARQIVLSLAFCCISDRLIVFFFFSRVLWGTSTAVLLSMWRFRLPRSLPAGKGAGRLLATATVHGLERTHSPTFL